ncbi:hypothetical protein [Nocardia sp. NBC_01388]|uniref:hypothetical protein n=1 Tax=Nocardia sp. NBC_01388 TaxID=2903596 RepID=UPI00324ACCFC
MNMSVFARSTVGIAAAAAMGVATIVSATTASAQLAITASSAYCADTTYTVTFPAADAAAMAAASGQNDLVMGATGPGPIYWWSPTVTYVPGQDVTFQWTPSKSVYAGQSAVGAWSLHVEEAHVVTTPSAPLAVNVVQTAPAGSSCTPSAGGTGSANSIPVIGGLLSTLSAQK